MFIPAFIMEDPLRSLFMPLTLAVGFAMISSYLLSSTFVPIMSVYLLKPKEHGEGQGRQEARPVRADLIAAITKLVEWFVRAALAGGDDLSRVPAVLVLGVLGLEVGTELFPRIDQGEFVLRFRPPAGSSYELTREMGLKCLQEIEKRGGH